MSTSSASSASKPSGGWQPPTLEEMQAMLPQYQFVSLLGRGGMGAVFKAVQVTLDRDVAIKVLPGDLVADDDDAQFAERFKNEARTMAKMNHPAIVNVYDFGETKTGLLYIVMEFIDGTDVAQMIASQGKLPEDYALSITAHVCDALAYAHTHRVIHRDIKPANILINMEGAVKVADFGLAKQSDAGQGGLTKTNMAMGTPDFVAPEALISGIPLDGRADLYAVGVMLYQMLTGEIPRGMWSLPGAKFGSDPRFDAIISKAMQTDRDARYQSAMDLRQDLDTILTLPRSVIIQQQQEAAEATARATQARRQRQAASGPQRRPVSPPKHEAPPPVKKKSGLGPVLGVLTSLVLVAVLFYMFKPPAEATKYDAAPAATTAPSGTTVTPEPAPEPRATQAPTPAPQSAPPTVVSTPAPALPTPAVPPTQPAPAEPVANVPAAKPGEVITFNKHRYQLVVESSNWSKARSKARSMGGHLATLTSAEENDFIQQSYTDWLKAPGVCILLGAYQESAQAAWQWETAEPFEYAGWYGGEPNRAAMADTDTSFAFLDHPQGRRGWDDKPEKAIGAFLIEWDDDGSAPRVAVVEPAFTEPVDLINLVDLQRDPVRGRGNWEVNGTDLVMKNDTTSTQTLAFKAQPLPEEYDYEIEFTLNAGAGQVVQVFSVGGHCVAWEMSGLLKVPIDPAHYAFGPALDDEWFDQREEAVVKLPRIQPGQRHRSVVEVRKGGSLRAVLDDKEVLAWRGDVGRFDAGLHKPSAGLHVAALSAYGTSITFHKVEVRPPWHRMDPRLVQLENGFNARYETDALKPYLAAVAALKKSYVTNGVARARRAAQAKGSLAEVTALDAEKAAIENGSGVPAEDAEDVPESLKSLRATYRFAFAKIAAELTDTAAPLYDIYVKALAAYIAELTRSGKIAEAQKVQTLREDIANLKQEPAPVARPGAPEKPVSTPSTPTLSSSSSWRRAAEWWLAMGGTLTVEKNGTRIDVRTEPDLPYGKFDIVNLAFDAQKAGNMPKPTDAGFTALEGLRDLLSVTVIADGLSDDAFAFLANQSNLEFLRLERMTNITDELLIHLSGAKKLRHLQLWGAANFTGARFADMPFLDSLQIASLPGCGITDDGLRALSNAGRLEAVTLQSPKITDAGCTSLAKMKSLKFLQLENSEFGDEGAAVVAQLLDLQTLNIQLTKITDAGLAKLSALKKLTELIVRNGNPQLSEAALVEFQKSMPSCRVR